MILAWIILFSFLPQETPFISVTKDNGEVIKISKVTFVQSKDGNSSDSILLFTKAGKNETISLSKLKRINFKELISRNKGVMEWRVVLVEKSNAKHEVKINLIELKGIDVNGEEHVIPAGNINKIIL